MATILVTGATGSVGVHVVDGLVGTGHRVRALTRHPDVARLPVDVDVYAGDLDDADSVAAALTGVDAMYLFPGGDLPNVLAAAGKARVQHVVLLSSASVTYAEPDASSVLHRAAELAVENSGLPHTLLRPEAFMGNDRMWIGEIRAASSVSSAYPDAATAPIDERDVAAAAVAALLRPADLPSTVHLSGPESLTVRERVGLLASGTGLPITLVELTPEQARDQMSRYLPAEAIDVILGVLAKAPAVAPVAPPVDLLGRAPHTYADWARAHRHEFVTSDRP